MKINKNYLLLMLIIGLSICKVSAQNKIYLTQFQAVNINKAYAATTNNVLRTYINMNNKYVAVIPDPIDSLYNEKFALKNVKAKNFGCDYILKGELNRLGETVIVTVNLYKGSDSTLVWSDLLKAATPDDLDKIYERIAANLGTDKKASKEADIYTVTQYQSKELLKERANRSYGIGLGGMAMNLPYEYKGIPAGISGILFYDARSFLGDASIDLYFGDKRFSYLAVNLMANYAFQKRQNTAYIGGGLALNYISYVQTESTTDFYGYNYNQDRIKSNGGISPIIDGGYIFNRTGAFKVRTGVRIILPTYQVADRYLFGAMFHVDVLFGN